MRAISASSVDAGSSLAAASTATGPRAAADRDHTSRRQLRDGERGGDVLAACADGAAPTAGGSGPRSGARLAYNPALDGIRGLAVLAVLFFHGGFDWARGGFLGVSTFFTLSGFLITSLLVGERLETGRVRLTAFWARRVRRLLPASALALAGISLSTLVLNETWERSLRGDVLAALAQVANWRFIADGQAYSDLFASPSPVLHFWSLAIEEQFYWLFPLLVVGVFALTRGSLKALAAVLAGLLAGSAVLTLALGSDRPTTIYYATPTRMGEILVGALLAVAVARRRRADGAPARAAVGAGNSARAPGGAGNSSRAAGGGHLIRRVVAFAGVGALAASVWAWGNVEQTSTWIYEGGFLAYALVSGVLVFSATVPGPVRSLLSVDPLRRLGIISYGVYVYHWPIFLLANEARTGLSHGALFAVRVGLTLAVATLSYVLLERPIRTGCRPRLPRLGTPILAAGALSAVALVAVPMPIVSTPPADPFEQIAASDPDPADISPSTLVGVSVGDSTMLTTGWGLSGWGDRTGKLTVLGASYNGGMGCGLTRGGERVAAGDVSQTPPGCDAWAETLPTAIASYEARYGHLDYAIVQTGPWDVADRRLPGDDTWRAPGDPIYDDYLRSELSELTDLLLDQGLPVVWLTAPHLDRAVELEVHAVGPEPLVDLGWQAVDVAGEVDGRRAGPGAGDVTDDLVETVDARRVGFRVGLRRGWLFVA
ncbi:MAG TPA: acyltransferase, partial [Acidimicrobiales bacterium]|nr:acyltransferase [Acidimicrobiales bacterium]